MRYCLVLLLVACGPSSGELQVLSYNVHGLPTQITGDNTDARLTAIGPLLNDYDVVGLQEVWLDDSWQLLHDGTAHPHVQRQIDTVNEDKVYGSGLVTLSDVPISATDFTFYDACHGLVDSGSDCLASKGFQRVTLDVGGVPVDLYNSHLDAGGGDEDDAARALQVDQLVASMNTASADRAVVFVGDTNLDGDSPEQDLVDRWLEQAGLVEACDWVQCDEPGRIDRVFFRSGAEVELDVTAWRVEPWLDDDGVPLSDHDPIGITLSWSR